MSLPTFTVVSATTIKSAHRFTEGRSL